MTKTQIAILWGLALVVVVVLVVVGQMLSRSPEAAPMRTLPPPQVYSLPEIPQSAHKLYPQAEQAARSWRSDAGLVSAVANWPFVELDDLSLPAAWTFQFYAPGAQRILVVNVDGDSVTPIREATSPYPLPTVSAQDWKLDSHQALNAWLNHGGGELLRAHPIVDLSARLRTSDRGELQWVVVGVARDEQAAQIVYMDAVSGDIVE